MSELTTPIRIDIPGVGSIESADLYLKSEADKVIESITEGAISMFRVSNKCRGLDLKSPLGRIANAAFKHWSFVEFIQNKNTQLQEDKERLLQNNHHLLDEVERLKEDVADARQKACKYQEIINEMEKRERHHKYKRCLGLARNSNLTTQPPSREKEKMMTRFARKKPVTIECMKYDGFNFDEVKKFCGDVAETHPNIMRGCDELYIKTLEGNHHASEGDVIIKGVDGEFYPCKPDIFEKTYELVDAPEAKPTDFVHSFSWALDRLKEGKRIHRSGWNGKGMFAVLQKGYPDGIPCNKQTAEAWGLKEGDLFRCEPYMQLKMVNGSHSMWVPSVNDCLSTDWAITG